MSVGSVRFHDMVLPCQSVYREKFAGDEEEFYPALYEALVRFSGLRLPTEEFRLQQSDQVAIEEQASSPMLLRLLQLLIFLTRPMRVLEVGTFIGISALYMARALPDGGRVVTVEKYEHFADLARQNVLTNHLQHKIQLLVGDAGEVLRRLDRSEPFDMIFLDGNKERYDQHFLLLDALLALHGLLVVDDVLFHGDVLNERPTSAKGAGVREFLEQVERRPGYQKLLLPIGNGVMLMRKEA
jgi:caffeoyl-CoA O-methyltransferase/O-methyltransferase